MQRSRYEDASPHSKASCSHQRRVAWKLRTLRMGSYMGLSDGAPQAVTLGLRKAFLLIALSCFACLFAAPAGADGLPPNYLPPAYAISGAALLVGNDVCGGLPCTETVAFSFDFGYQFLPDLDVYQAYLLNFAESASGALGSFTESFAGPFPPSEADNHFIALGNSDFELDIHSSVGIVPAPVTPSLLDFADLYSCETAACITDFAPSDFQGEAPPIFGLHNPSGPVVYTVTAIPEPATLALLLCGLLTLGLWEAISRKRRIQAMTPALAPR